MSAIFKFFFSGAGAGAGAGFGSAHSDCSCPIYDTWTCVGKQPLQDQKQLDSNTNTDISRRVCGAFRTLPLMYTTQVPGERRTRIPNTKTYSGWFLSVRHADGHCSSDVSGSSAGSGSGVVRDGDELSGVDGIDLFGDFDYVRYACECIPSYHSMFRHPYLEQYGYIGTYVNHSQKFIHHKNHTCKQHHTKQRTGFTLQIHWKTTQQLTQQPQSQTQEQEKQSEKQKPKQQQQQHQEREQECSQDGSGSGSGSGSGLPVGSLTQSLTPPQPPPFHSASSEEQKRSNNDGFTITYDFQVTGQDTAILSVCGVAWSLLMKKKRFEKKAQRLVDVPDPVPVPTFDPPV